MSTLSTILGTSLSGPTGATGATGATGSGANPGANVQWFASNAGVAGVYTFPGGSGYSTLKITTVGPGGNTQLTSSANRCSGAGAGAVCTKWITDITANQTLYYTISAPLGTNSYSNVSSGTYTLASNVSSQGGGNGVQIALSNSLTAGGPGGNASGGDIMISGGSGYPSFGSSTTSTTNFSGRGGDCPGFGTGGGSGGVTTSVPAAIANSATGYGAGAGAAYGSVASSAWYSGRSGIIIFEAY